MKEETKLEEFLDRLFGLPTFKELKEREKRELKIEIEKQTEGFCLTHNKRIFKGCSCPLCWSEEVCKKIIYLNLIK